MRRLLAVVFAGWTAWIAAMLTLAGHPVQIAIGSALIVAVQASAGVVLWRWISVDSPPLATIAMGSLIGFVAAALGGVVALGTPVVGWGWTLPIVVAVALLPRVGGEVVEMAEYGRVAILALVMGVIGLSTEWTWLVPTALAGIAVVLVRRGSLLGEPFVDSPKRIQHIAGACVALAVLAQSAVLTLRSPHWSQFRQSRLDIPDHIFFDALGRAAARYGGSDSGLVAGVQSPYHWLPYAWAGRITVIMEGFSPALVSHLIQIVFVPLVGMLTALVAERLGTRTAVAAVAGLFAVSVVGVPITLAQTLVVYSPSQVAATAIVLAVIALLLGEYLVVNRRWGLVLLVCAGFAAVGSKAVAIVPLVALGVVHPLVGSVSTFASRATTSLVLAVGVVGGYIYFLSGRIAGDTSGILTTSLADVAIADGPIGVGSDSPTMRLFGVLALAGLLVAVVPGIVFVREFRSLAFSVLAVGLSPVLFGLLYVGNRNGVNYFFNVGLAVLIPLAIAAVDHRSRDLGDLPAKTLVVAMVAGLVVAAGWSNAYLETSSTSTPSSLLRAGLLVLPILAGLTVASVMSIGQSRAVVAAVCMIAVSAGSYVAWVPRYAVLHVRQGSSVATDADLLSGRPEYREALNWLRRNSQSADVVATNRFCDDSSARYPDCHAAWALVSAVSDRRVFAECPSFTAGWFPSMADRIELSGSFARSPSAASASKIRAKGVRWMFIDRAVDRDVDYGSFATVRFENDEALILELTGTGS